MGAIKAGKESQKLVVTFEIRIETDSIFLFEYGQ